MLHYNHWLAALGFVENKHLQEERDYFIFKTEFLQRNLLIHLQSQGGIFHSGTDGKALTEDLQTMCETISDSS